MRTTRVHRQVLGALAATLAMLAGCLVLGGTASAAPSALAAAPTVTQVATGESHTCALYSDTTVKCWGYNAYGQLGNGTNTGSSVPVTVTGLTGAIQIDVGGYHSCAVLGNGTARCWGWNYYKQLGNGSQTNSNVPVTVTGLAGATTIAANANSSCAALSDHSARCWGRGGNGQLGNGGTIDSSVPVTVTGLTNADRVAGGDFHSCALLGDGTARCWGYNFSGQLGDGTNANTSLPVTVSGLTSATRLSSGAYFACGVLGDQTVRCWGENSKGQLGNSTNINSNVPVTVTGLSGTTAIGSGDSHSCAVIGGGAARCWGLNHKGQLGNGTKVDSNVPVSITGIAGAIGIDAGETHSCAVLGNGTVRCWGDNASGQLGNGTNVDSNVPVTVSGTSVQPTEPAQPAPPTRVAGTNQVALSWTAPADGGSPITGYRIVPSSYGVAQPAIEVGNVTSKTVTGLRGGVSYTFTVAARNSIGLGAASVPSAWILPKSSSAESFVTAAYQDYIGRAPTGPELTAGLVIVGDASSIEKRAQFTTALAQSDTYLGAVVNKLYVDTLGRVGDPGGVTYWTNELRSGRVTVAQTAGLFYASPEYFSGYGENNLTTWVNDLYQKVLLRSPDPGGLNYYVNLAATTNRYTVAFPFYQSLESSNTRVKGLFLHFLGRPADQGGLDYWASKIPALGDVALASNLTLSAEYLSRAATRYP